MPAPALTDRTLTRLIILAWTPAGDRMADDDGLVLVVEDEWLSRDAIAAEALRLAAELKGVG